MSNEIGQRQNARHNIDRLAAQRHLYSKAKALRVVQVIVNFSLAPAGAIIATIMVWLSRDSRMTWEWIPATSGIAAILVNEFLRVSVRAQTEAAARVQEVFDCEVLRISWNDHLVGDPPQHELVAREATEFRQRGGDIASLHDWYAGDVSAVPMEVARIVCQRQSVVWDDGLRRSYIRFVRATCFITITFLFLLGLARDMTLPSFVIGFLLPVAPLLLFLYEEYAENSRQAEKLEQMHQHLQEAWSHVVEQKWSGATIDDEARRVQDLLYLHRESAPLVLDRLYWSRRERQESESAYSTSVMLDQYRLAAGT